MCQKCKCIACVIGLLSIAVFSMYLFGGKKKRFCCGKLWDDCMNDLSGDLSQIKTDMTDMVSDVKNVGMEMKKTMMGDN